MKQKCNAVFEGGGVRGIGFAGAIASMEAAGYKFQNVVGSSAGAIAAALIAAGYTGEEIKTELNNVDYKKFHEKSRLGDCINLLRNYGIYKTNYFEKWFKGLLQKKGKNVFGDLNGQLQVTASDLTDRKILILPRDLEQFGIDPDTFSIAAAVKMSMSIPLYFDACRLTDKEENVHVIVDGGLLSNYPIWILDDGSPNTKIPTFGFKFNSDATTDKFSEPMEINSLIDYGKAVVSTMLLAGDNYHISVSKGDLQRSIIIPIGVADKKGKTKYITATDFNLTREESDMLYANGYHSASSFLKTWDFNKWNMQFRQ